MSSLIAKLRKESKAYQYEMRGSYYGHDQVSKKLLSSNNILDQVKEVLNKDPLVKISSIQKAKIIIAGR